MADGHAIIIGQTMSGKTICAQRLAQNYRQHGIKVAVLDPHKDPAWSADYLTGDTSEYLSLVRDPAKCTQCALFIDEAGRSLDKYDGGMDWITCEARHHGHRSHLICQRAQQVSMNVRTQCSTLYCFNICEADAKIYASDFNCRELLCAPQLPKGHFFLVERFQAVKRLRLW